MARGISSTCPATFAACRCATPSPGPETRHCTASIWQLNVATRIPHPRLAVPGSRHVVRGHHPNGRHRRGDSAHSAVALNDHPPGEIRVGPQIVMEHCRDFAGAQQRPVVLVEVVGDEHPVAAAALLERADGGDIAAADGVHRTDGRVAVERVENQLFDGRVEPLAFGDIHHRPPLPAQGTAHLTAKPHLPLFFSAKGVAAQRDQHTGRRATQPLVDQIGRGRTGVTVVDAHVADTTAARYIGDKGDHGDAIGGTDPVSRKWKRLRTTAGANAGSSASTASWNALENRCGACMTTSTRYLRPANRSWERWLSRSPMACSTSRRVDSRTFALLCGTASTVASLNPAC